MDLWGPHQYAGPSVWRGSEPMCGALRGGLDVRPLDSQSVGPHNIVCGALRGLDMQSIYGALIRMWGPR